MFGFGGTRSKPLVLHVDDDKDICMIIRTVLEEMGLDTISALNGPEGLALAKKKAPDLVILDVRMPGMDGFEVCLQIKSDEKTRHIPVLMTTSMGTMKDVEKALANGADGYTIKPLNFPAFKEKVSKLLKLPPPAP